MVVNILPCLYHKHKIRRSLLGFLPLISHLTFIDAVQVVTAESMVVTR
jgi:hypothetical protein